MRSIKQKLIDFSLLETASETWRSQYKRIITTNGCFDLLHWGHIAYLQQARSLGDALICAVNADKTVTELKGSSRPIFKDTIRAAQLASLECVDYVTIFSEETPELFLSIVKPLIHVKGGDYEGLEIPEKKILEAIGSQLICLPFIKGYSTTQIIQRLIK